MQLKVDESSIRVRIRVNGIVQGVGFRPFVYRLASQHGLVGNVLNDTRGVLLEAEGSRSVLEAFVAALEDEAPAQAQIRDTKIEMVPTRGESSFTITESEAGAASSTMISPDIGTCEACQKELLSPHDRRYKYPFTNCTHCGPRYTIVRQIPYDRPNTSMGVFELCPECEREYREPTDRRFHAQPNACSVCGPELSLMSADGNAIHSADPISDALNLIATGNVLAIRGLGGFHLVVDAHSDDAVRLLRERKGRVGKPFALMADSVATVRKYCHVSEEEECILEGPARPIVLLQCRRECEIAFSVAPGQRYLGFMLPYTPVHHLLLNGRFDALVMTSANHAEEPIAIANDEALERLSGIADFFLLHNREILQRCDDSVVRVVNGKRTPLRRSRGFVPAPVALPMDCSENILAVGGELKNVIALSRNTDVFLSQHIGDLDNPSAFAFFEDSIGHLASIMEIEPDVVVCDLHPEYLSTKWARRQDLPAIYVQHHHAHLASVMAENNVTDPTIGIILDGTGYGTDGTIWGGEVLVGDLSSFERFGHLEQFVIPGGEKAIREPWRLALALLFRDFDGVVQDLDLPFLAGRTNDDVCLIQRMIQRGINSPITSSAGRLFDAVSALTGIRTEVSYEAEAAIDLEMSAWDYSEEPYPEAVVGGLHQGVLGTSAIVRAVVRDVVAGEATGRIAARFHASMAAVFLNAARAARDAFQLNRVGLSGGVFQNIRLLHLLSEGLVSDGFEVITHSQVPTNDGGLSYGQAAVASAIINKRGA